MADDYIFGPPICKVILLSKCQASAIMSVFQAIESHLTGVIMLEVFRKKGVNKTILWIISVVVISSFVLWGAAYRYDTGNSVGTMYGQNVSRNDFMRAYDDAQDQAIRVYGDRYFRNQGKIDLEQETWDRMILIKEAERRGVTVSDQEVVAFIASLPFVETNGQFDQVEYSLVLQRVFNRSSHDFENGVRKQLMIKKLLDQVAPEAPVSDAQLKAEYDKRNEKLTLAYVLFKASDFARNAQASDDELKKYYDLHKEEFREPPSIVLKYVQTKDKALADTLSKELTPGADFEAVAKPLKLEVKTSSAFSQDAPILTFASNPDNIDKLFKMKPGEYSPILEAPDGWQIVQIKDKNESAVPPLEAIKDKVKDAVLVEKGFALAKPQADKALGAIRETLKTKDFKQAATDLGLKPEETPAFGRRDYIANTGLVQEFQQEADALNMAKRLSGVISTSQGPAIIYLQKMEKPDNAQFESDKENFKEMLSAEKRSQVLITFMSELRAKADVKSRIKHQSRTGQAD